MPRRIDRTIAEHALAAAESGLRVFPLIPLGKLPLNKGWLDQATTDPETIMGWFLAEPGANYGIRTGDVNDLIVVDVDGPKAQEHWASLGFGSGAVVKTTSGPNRSHHYFRTPENVDIRNSQGAKGGIFVDPENKDDHIDVRGWHGLVVGPGSKTPTGTYVGDISDIPDAPQGLIELLPKKQKFYATEIPDDVPVVEEAGAGERRVLKWIVEDLLSLPAVWAPGSGWHDTVYGSACFLQRIANSPYYALDQAGARAILFQNTPTYEGWGAEEIERQWLSALESTAGQWMEAPHSFNDDIPTLIPLFKAQERMPEFDSTGRQFLDLTISQPTSDTLPARWNRVHTILLESFRADLDMSHAMTFACTSVAAEPIMSEADGRLRVFREAQRAHKEVEAERETGALTVVEEYMPQEYDSDPVLLLADDEREMLETEEFRWFGCDYLEWAKASDPLANLAYHRIDMWIALSTIFGGVAQITADGRRPLGVNLWAITIGPSSSGKSEALSLMEDLIDACWPDDDTPNIGADATTEALHDALILRDGKPSIMAVDEAHRLLGELAGGKSFRGDLITSMTEFFDGKVRASQRSSKKEISGKRASTSFGLLLQGTPDRMRSVLPIDLWTRGFLPRALFVIGEKGQIPEGALDVQFGVAKGDRARAKTLLQWAADLKEYKRKVNNRFGQTNADGRVIPFEMQVAPEAQARFNIAMRKMRAILASKPNQDALEPYANRIPTHLAKMMSLVALSQGRGRVEERDVLIALADLEIFITAGVEVSKMSVDSEFSREVDELEQMIAKEQGRMETAVIYRRMKRPSFEVDKLISQLSAERRVRRAQAPTGENVVEILRANNEGAIAA